MRRTSTLFAAALMSGVPLFAFDASVKAQPAQCPQPCCCRACPAATANAQASSPTTTPTPQGWGFGRAARMRRAFATPTPAVTPAPATRPAPQAAPAPQPPAAPQPGPRGMGRGMGMMGMGRGGMSDFVQSFHALLTAHEKIHRIVEDTPAGVVTLTTSDDPTVTNLIRLHVRQMKDSFDAGRPVRTWDPLFVELFRHRDQVRTQVEDVPGGV